MKQNLLKLILSFTLTIFASLLLAIPALALPVDQTPHTVKQSCGTPLTIRSIGDEFLSWSETLSGDIVTYNRGTNNWYYAYVDEDQLRPSENKARPIAPLFGGGADALTSDDLYALFEAAAYYRGQQAVEIAAISSNITNNRIPLLVILLEFSDRQFSDVYLTPEFPTHSSFFSNDFFGDSGKTLNTYFAEVSGGFDLQFVPPSFTVADGFRLDNPTGPVNSLEVRDGVVRVKLNTTHPNTRNSDELTNVVREVSDAFNAFRSYIDFSDLALSDAGHVSSQDFITLVMVAGYEHTASPGHLHPRMNGHAQPPLGISLTPESNTFRMRGYTAVGELTYHTTRGYGAMGIGGAVHEIGHIFGLPDLYDHHKREAALGNFSVMCHGSHVSSIPNGRVGSSPPLFDPWSKIQLGFIEPYVVDAGEHKPLDLFGRDANSPYNVVKVTSAADPDQYFLIENRRAVGFDAPISRSNPQNHGGVPRGDGGILIYHIDERAIGNRGFRVNDNRYHRGVELETMMVAGSDNFNHFNFNPFFVQGGLRYAFTPYTTPNSNFHEPGICYEHRSAAFDCHPQTVISGISVQVNSVAGQVMEIEIGIPCPIVAEGRLPNQAVSAGGMRGAAWTLCACGTLEVGEGFVHQFRMGGSWSSTISPWNAHRHSISRIVFSENVVMGYSLAGLFRDLSSVTTIEGLGYFETSNVEIMYGVFSGMHSLTSLDLSNWNTSNVTNMSNLFNGTRSLDSLDLSNWNTGNVTNMRRMFFQAHALSSLDIANWNTSNVTDMSSMFFRTDALTELDVSRWNTSNVTNMNDMFGAAHSLVSLDLSNWDTSRVASMGGMFSGARSLVDLDVSDWDTSRVTNMFNMFTGASSLIALDLSNWDTSRVTDMTGMFARTHSLASLDLSGWDTYNVGQARMNNLFAEMTNLRSLTLGKNFVLRGGPMLPVVRVTFDFTGLWQNVGDGTPERPRGEHFLTSAQLMSQFNGATMADTWVWQPVISDCRIVATGRLTSQTGADGIHGVFWVLCECGVLTVSEGFINWTGTASPWGTYRTAINEIVFTGPITAGASLSGLFGDLPNVKTIEGLEYFDTSNVTNMTRMFAFTNSLAGLDVSNFDTSNVINMAHMFSNARSLTSLDVSSFDTSNVTNMSNMFSWMTSLTSLDVSNFDTSNVIDMGSIFSGMHSLVSLDVTNWDVSGGIRVASMFSSTAELRILTVGEKWRFGSGLPAIRTTPEFTGYWQNVGSGTLERPRGEHVLTSAQLMAQFNGATMADTWVWQPR